MSDGGKVVFVVGEANGGFGKEVGAPTGVVATRLGTLEGSQSLRGRVRKKSNIKNS